MRSEGFPPVERGDARVLILGSLPGARSIREQRYYAHPQNVFWTIMRDMFGIDGNYETCCVQLTEQGIALWDVLHSSVRPGSMDADIRMDSARANDFEEFFLLHSKIELIAFNGRKAEQLFGRFVEPLGLVTSAQRLSLPSTSPAYASMPYSGKLAAWRKALAGD